MNAFRERVSQWWAKDKTNFFFGGVALFAFSNVALNEMRKYGLVGAPTRESPHPPASHEFSKRPRQ